MPRTAFEQLGDAKADLAQTVVDAFEQQRRAVRNWLRDRGLAKQRRGNYAAQRYNQGRRRRR